VSRQEFGDLSEDVCSSRWKVLEQSVYCKLLCSSGGARIVSQHILQIVLMGQRDVEYLKQSRRLSTCLGGYTSEHQLVWGACRFMMARKCLSISLMDFNPSMGSDCLFLFEKCFPREERSRVLYNPSMANTMPLFEISMKSLLCQQETHHHSPRLCSEKEFVRRLVRRFVFFPWKVLEQSVYCKLLCSHGGARIISQHILQNFLLSQRDVSILNDSPPYF
jgi:hypothetical protein